MKTVNYTISDETRRFLDALCVFQDFKSKVLYALTALYGDEQGEKFYNAETEQFDKIEHTLWEYMRAQVTSCMFVGMENIEI